MAKLKICGLTCKEDIEAVNGAKPDFAGFIIEVPGRRRSLTAEQVKVLVKGLDKEILPVGVFVNAAPELPISLLRDGTLWAAQLHGDEDEDYIEKIQNMTGKPVIKAFSIKTPEDVQRALRSPADYILLDHGAGGTGSDRRVHRGGAGRPADLSGIRPAGTGFRPGDDAGFGKRVGRSCPAADDGLLPHHWELLPPGGGQRTDFHR